MIVSFEALLGSTRAGNHTLDGIENAIGEAGSDQSLGEDGDDTMTGSEGADSFHGGAPTPPDDDEKDRATDYIQETDSSCADAMGC